MDIIIAKQIFKQKKIPKALWDNNVHPLEHGRKSCGDT